MGAKIVFNFLIILAVVWITNAISTKTCNHNQFSEKVRNLATCLNKELFKSVNLFLKDLNVQLRENNYTYDLRNACPVAKRFSENVKNCAMSLTSSCFDEKTTELIKFALKVADVYCDNLQLLFEAQGPSQIPQQVIDWENRMENELDIRNFGFEPWKIESLSNLWTLDKKCSWEMMDSAWMDSPAKCTTLWNNFISPLERYDISLQIPDDFTSCTELDNFINSCVVENDCVSIQEIALIKALAWKIYSISMNTTVQIKYSFGGVKDAMDAIFKTRITIYNIELLRNLTLDSYIENSTVISEIKSRYGMIADKLIDDFKSEKCKETIAKNSGGNVHFSFLIVISISLISIIISL